MSIPVTLQSPLGEAHGDAASPQGASSTRRRRQIEDRGDRRRLVVGPRLRGRAPELRLSPSWKPTNQSSPAAEARSSRLGRLRRDLDSALRVLPFGSLRENAGNQRAEPAARCCARAVRACGSRGVAPRLAGEELAHKPRGLVRALDEGRCVTPSITTSSASGSRRRVARRSRGSPPCRARRRPPASAPDRREVDALGLHVLGRRADHQLERAPLHGRTRSRPRAPRSARSAPCGVEVALLDSGPPPPRRRRSRPTSVVRQASVEQDQLGHELRPPRRDLEADLAAERRANEREARRRARLEVVGVENSPDSGSGMSPKPRSSWRTAPGSSKPSHIEASQMPAWTRTINACRRRRPTARGRRGTPPAAPPRGPPASCASCPTSASRAACACG